MHPLSFTLSPSTLIVPRDSENKGENGDADGNYSADEQTKWDCDCMRALECSPDCEEWKWRLAPVVSKAIPEEDRRLRAIVAIASAGNVEMPTEMDIGNLIEVAMLTLNKEENKCTALKALCRCKNIISEDKISLLHEISSITDEGERGKVMEEFARLQLPMYTTSAKQLSFEYMFPIKEKDNWYDNYGLKKSIADKVITIPEKNLQGFLDSMANDSARVDVLGELFELTNRNANFSEELLDVSRKFVTTVSDDRLKALVLERILFKINFVNNDKCKKLLELIDVIKNESYRACVLISAFGDISISDYDADLFSPLFEFTSKIADESLRVTILREIAGYLYNFPKGDDHSSDHEDLNDSYAMIAKLFSMINCIANEGLRVSALEAVIRNVERLPKNYHMDLLKFIAGIGGENFRASALCSISDEITSLDVECQGKVIELIGGIKDGASLAPIFDVIAPEMSNLDVKFQGKLLDFAGEITDENFRALALCSISGEITSLDVECQGKVIKLIGGINDGASLVSVLRAIAPKIPRLNMEFSKKLLSFAGKITDENSRASALCAISGEIASLDVERQGEVIKLIGEIKDGSSLASILRVIAPEMPNLDVKFHEKLLDLAGGIADKNSRASALVAIAQKIKCLDDTLCTKFFDFTGKVTSENLRAAILQLVVLSKLPPDSSNFVWEEMFFRLAGDIKNEAIRGVVLGSAARIFFGSGNELYLNSRDMLFDAVSKIVDEGFRANALLCIAEQLLYGKNRSRMIDLVASINNEKLRVKILLLIIKNESRT
jgi:hypothetical protein